MVVTATLVEELNSDVVNSDDTIGATNVDSLSVGGPADGDALGSLFELIITLDLDLGEKVLALVCDIPDLNTVVGGGGQPLVVSVEGQRVDDGVALVFHVWLFQVNVIPDFHKHVFTTGGDIHTVTGNSEGIDIRIVSLDGSLELEDTGPDLKTTIPADRGVVVCLSRLGETDLRDPILMIVLVVGLTGGHLAFGKGVPEHHALIGTTGEDLTVILGEGSSQDFLGVSEELTDALAGSEVPQSHALIPRGGDNEGVVVRDGEISDEVVVTGEALEGDTTLGLGILLESPDDEGLVSGTGHEDGVLVILGLRVASDDAGDHIGVAFKEAGELN